MTPANKHLMARHRQSASLGLWPHEVMLPAGSVIYRFIDLSRSTPHEGADGPWWFEFEHYQTIRHFALRHGYSLGYTARLFAAILYEWSAVNAVARARLKVPLTAWKGRGKQVRPSTADPRDQISVPRRLVTGDGSNYSAMTPLQSSLEVYQLYVPGLGAPLNADGSRTIGKGMFDDYLDLQGWEPIATESFTG